MTCAASAPAKWSSRTAASSEEFLAGVPSCLSLIGSALPAFHRDLPPNANSVLTACQAARLSDVVN
eukprot:335163-Heterocapsa_arctica.AAC.1